LINSIVVVVVVVVVVVEVVVRNTTFNFLIHMNDDEIGVFFLGEKQEPTTTTCML
jgi:hypothetical protein